MFKTTVILLVSLCGLQARAPAQLQVGLNIGKCVSTQAIVRPQPCSTGSAYRVFSNCDVAHRGVHGHARWVTRKVWVPGRFERVRVPPVYRTVRLGCYRTARVLVRPASYRNVYRAGYWKQVRERATSCC